MKLFQVRKGQFVFYKNELHKVYSVKPMFRKSIHLYRLKDMQQILTSASEIKYYKPKHGDTFIFYGRRYTIDQDMKPSPGDYILIIKPTPDLLDHYSLNDIEKVDKIENNNVITTRDNGVKHNEYVVMVPGRKENTQEIAYFDKSLVPEAQQIEDESVHYLAEDVYEHPIVGDVYLDVKENTKAMVVAVKEKEVVLGHGVTLHLSDLMNEDNYVFVSRLNEA